MKFHQLNMPSPEHVEVSQIMSTVFAFAYIKVIVPGARLKVLLLPFSLKSKLEAHRLFNISGGNIAWQVEC